MSVTLPIKALNEFLTHWPHAELLVAVSGGMDSMALLHALAMHMPKRVKVVHINHNLCSESASWGTFVTETAAQYDIPCTVLNVTVQRRDQGIEAAAREARYHAFLKQMTPQTLLLTAHHAQDQAETLLMRMMRGASISGLAAIRPSRPFGSGHIGRPWLSITRQQIHNYAQEHKIKWTVDPSNNDENFDRNWIRKHIFAPLQQRWPQAITNMAHSAHLLHETAQISAQKTQILLAQMQGLNPKTLNMKQLLSLPITQSNDVIRTWYLSLGLPPPGRVTLQIINAELLPAKADANPLVCWPGAELRRYQNTLYANHKTDILPTHYHQNWNGLTPHILPNNLGVLTFNPTLSTAIDLSIQSRQGGECMVCGTTQHASSIKHILQNLCIPPWLRMTIPIIYWENELAALGDLRISARFAKYLKEHQTRIHWKNGPL